MDQIKESFSKVKQDIDALRGELEFLKKGVFETRNQMIDVCEALIKLNEKIQDLGKKNQFTQETINNLHIELAKTQINTPIPTQNQENPTHNPEYSTNPQQIYPIPTHNPTDNSPFKPLNTQNKLISIGNGGVPTDRQTHQQTDTSLIQQTQIPLKTPGNSLDNALEILESLDIIKKEIRLKFKKLTDQEWLIFSTIYQLEEELGYADYRTLAERLKLTESSIRDYAGRLIKKGIPVEKNKINNKAVHLSISPNLKKIATLPTIMQLRDL